MKVFKKQLIMCIKRLRQFCGIKKNPEKTRVVRTTHGRWRTLKFLCPPTTMRCTHNKPFSSKLLTLQGNGKHKQCFICHALSYSRLRAKSETKNMSGRERVKQIHFNQILTLGTIMHWRMSRKLRKEYATVKRIMWNWRRTMWLSVQIDNPERRKKKSILYIYRIYSLLKWINKEE